MSQEQRLSSREGKDEHSPDYYDDSKESPSKSINQTNTSVENNNNKDTGVDQREIDEDAVYNLASSVVESLYAGSDEGDDSVNGFEREFKQPSLNVSNENQTPEASQREEDDDYDFEIDQENLIGNIIANAVQGMAKEKGVDVTDKSLSDDNNEQLSMTAKDEEAFRSGNESSDPKRHTEEETTSKIDEKDNKVEEQDEMKEDELEDVIANALKDQFHLEEIPKTGDEESDLSRVSQNQEKKGHNDDNQHDDDQSGDRNLDLMAAINDAMAQNIENIQESAVEETGDEKDVDEEFDEEFELNAAIADALRKTESVLKQKDYHENNSYSEQSHLDNEDLEGVIQEIDMNHVMQSALNENEDEKDSEYDANHELNSAIKEALMTVPKKPAGPAPAKKTSNKVSMSKDKIDLSTELTNVISNALKESGLVNRDNVNEFDIEAALKEVVSGVIEHNLVSQPQQRIENTTEKEPEYNWDDIMDNAFEMAMQYPEDLRFDVDEHGHATDSTKQQNLDSGLKKKNYGKITKKSLNRQHLLVPQSKPTGSLTKDLKNRFPLSVTSSKISAVATVTTVLDSLRLGEIDVNDVFRLKASKLDNIKRNVSSVLSSLINSTSTSVKDQIPKHQLDEKEKLRLENRERKKRWREFNIERNRDIDLKTRVIKRANHLYPLPEHEVLKKEWIETEFKKRKQKRLEREQKKNINMIDVKNFDAKDILSFDTFFKNRANLSKIVEIYNEMGGMVTEDKLLSSSADRTASVTSIATVIAAAYLVEKEKQQFANINHENDEDDEYSIIQSLVVSVDKYLKNKDHIQRVDYIADNSRAGGWDVSVSDGDDFERKPLNSAISLKPMKIAPVTGGATFKVNLDDIKLVESPSFPQREMGSNAMRPSGKLTSKFRHNGMMNTIGNDKKKYDDSKNKKKAKPLVINFEKFLVPNPPKPEVSSKRKGSFATQIINNMEPSLKKRLANERDVINIINNNNDFDIDYDMDSIDISNSIEHEFNQMDNDAAKENLKMIEKQLSLQVQQMQSENGSDDQNNNVDDDALASVVNQVVGALEDNFRDTLEEPDTNSEKNGINNDKDNEDSNINSGIDSTVKSLSEPTTDSLSRPLVKEDVTNKREKSVELDDNTNVEVKESSKKTDMSTNEATSEISSLITTKMVSDKTQTKKEESSHGVSVDPALKAKIDIKKKSKPKPVNHIPKIPLPQYGMPKPVNKVTKLPKMKPIEKVSSAKPEASTKEDVKVGGIKRPGAFRKPTAFKRPGDTRGSNIRPFGGIPVIKKL